MVEFEINDMDIEDYFEAHEACARSNGHWHGDYIEINNNITTVSIVLNEYYDDDDDVIDIKIPNHLISEALYDAYIKLSNDYFNDDDNEN